MSCVNVIKDAYVVAKRCVRAYEEFVKCFGDHDLKQSTIDRYTFLTTYIRDSSSCKFNSDEFWAPNDLLSRANKILKSYE